MPASRCSGFLTLHSDLFCRKLSNKPFFVWKYITGFHFTVGNFEKISVCIQSNMIPSRFFLFLFCQYIFGLELHFRSLCFFMTIPYIGFCQGIFSSSFLCYLWPQWLGRLLHFSKVPQYRRGSAKNRNLWKWEQKKKYSIFVLGIKFYLYTFW